MTEETAIQVELRYLKEAIDRLEKNVSEMQDTVNKLQRTFDLGKGAWWIIAKIGGILLAVSTIGVGFYSAFFHKGN